MTANDDPLRGTGRTTALLFQALANATMARGEWIPFFDHVPLTCVAAQKMGKRLRALAKCTGLLVRVVADRRTVKLRSAMERPALTETPYV